MKVRELVSVCKYDIRDRKRVKFHKSGKYVPDYSYEASIDASLGMFKPTKPWEDENSYNNGRQYTRCGILSMENPFAIGKNNMREPLHIILRRDHAEKFATPCKRCFSA